VRALVVEDDDIFAEILTDILTHRGHEVDVASSGEQAVKMASERQFDLAIVDIRLPNSDGWNVARRLNDGYHIPCVAVTAYHTREVEQAATAEGSGFVAYFPKPVDIATFGQEAERLIS
jgi:CheY-like chemotaxis protein